MFRIIIFILIILLIIVSLGGYIATSAGWLSDDLTSFYNTHFSFITGLASVVGLLAFSSSRKIKSTDFEKEELDQLQSLMVAAKNLENLETNKTQTEQELLDLERKKKLMELSVKKAGMVLFYKSQLERHETLILNKIEDDKELKLAVKESIDSITKLESLDEEIDKDENSVLIRSILNKHTEKGSFSSNDPIVLAIELASKSLTRFFHI